MPRPSSAFVSNAIYKSGGEPMELGRDGGALVDKQEGLQCIAGSVTDARFKPRHAHIFTFRFSCVLSHLGAYPFSPPPCPATTSSSSKKMRSSVAGQGIDKCARLPPNGTKVVTDWELAGAAAGKTATNGYTNTTHRAGSWIRWAQVHAIPAHSAHPRPPDKLDPLPLTASMSKASSSGRATVYLGAEVVAIDSEAVAVTLAFGEVFSYDAIIGADGRHGFVRWFIVREEGKDSSGEMATGMALCSAIIPRDKVEAEGGEVSELAYEEQMLGLWLGTVA
ncbi:hypothetical protein MKEN_01315200 [Mycena kentingensis (nom. inval.)]|nr:hypothetical protein MKEN_01315200 [Mycena kentingensis (nom. inval.)]